MQRIFVGSQHAVDHEHLTLQESLQAQRQQSRWTPRQPLVNDVYEALVLWCGIPRLAAGLRAALLAHGALVVLLEDSLRQAPRLSYCVGPHVPIGSLDRSPVQTQASIPEQRHAAPPGVTLGMQGVQEAPTEVRRPQPTLQLASDVPLLQVLQPHLNTEKGLGIVEIQRFHGVGLDERSEGLRNGCLRSSRKPRRCITASTASTTCWNRPPEDSSPRRGDGRSLR
mmetsp:Transcript_6142/g.14853  ORF Transcript_6142/g.14853 Transcript_6142/m.14853 type:complete len:225 (-) Transcript_6142:124-798(-)